MKSLNSLIITHSNNKLDIAADKACDWLEALATAYSVLKDGGEHITIVSLHGGQISLDVKSQSSGVTTENIERCRHDAQAVYHFSHSLPLNEVKAENFDLVFLAGGYEAMFDFVNNKSLNRILEDFDHQNKPIGLVGHAAAVLVSLKAVNGEPLVKGRKVTAFSNSEEELERMIDKLPFSLESKLVSLGALYSKGPAFASHVVVDGNIITGQNPASSLQAIRQLLSLAHHNEIMELEGNMTSIVKQ